MRNLIAANFQRLLKNRAFWLAVILMSCFEGFFYLLMLRNGSAPMDVYLFSSLQCIGILFAIFFSLFLGIEYSDGTLRNKIIVGHKRSNIYLASLITGIIAITIICLAGVLTGCVIGILLYGAPYYNLGQILLAGIVGWFACVALVSIYNLVGMLSSSKALTAIICILIAFALLFSAYFTFNLLSKPNFLVGVEREIVRTQFEVNPSGQLVLVMSIDDISSPWRLTAYSLLLFFVLTGLGTYFFHKKDLK